MNALRDINAAINRAIQYTPDQHDDWQTPRETQRRGTGDCEDYAIAKMAEALALGYPPDDVRLVYCRRTLGRITTAHMVLEVDGWILDNLGMSINRWHERPDLKPLFAFTAHRFWVAGRSLDVDPQHRLSQWGRCVARARRQGDWLGERSPDAPLNRRKNSR